MFPGRLQRLCPVEKVGGELQWPTNFIFWPSSDERRILQTRLGKDLRLGRERERGCVGYLAQIQTPKKFFKKEKG